jgi:hypothetical protein
LIISVILLDTAYRLTLPVARITYLSKKRKKNEKSQTDFSQVFLGCEKQRKKVEKFVGGVQKLQSGESCGQFECE